MVTQESLYQLKQTAALLKFTLDSAVFSKTMYTLEAIHCDMATRDYRK